jgi:aminoglycoside phosphotransferase (APT) family kinase protein
VSVGPLGLGLTAVPVPTRRDPEETKRALACWLAPRLDELAESGVASAVGGGVAGAGAASAGDAGAGDAGAGGSAGGVEVTGLSVPSGAGFSNETLVVDVAGPSGRDRFVLRVEPTGFRLFLESDFELQYRLLVTLGESTSVPVPPVLWFEPDPRVLGAPFFVMRHVDGRAVPDSPPYNEGGWLAEAPAAERERVWRNAVDALIAVHRVPLSVVSFLAKPSLGETGLDQALTYWGRSFEWAARGRPQPVAEAAWDWLTQTRNRPRSPDTALSWGDARMGNMLFRQPGGEVAAVLDWEMLSLGGPVMDLGWWLFLDDYHSFAVPRLPGLGSRADTIALWESGTGRRAVDLEWYEVFAGFRFAIVMMRMAQMFESWGVLGPGLEDMETNNDVLHVLARKLDIPPPGPR